MFWQYYFLRNALTAHLPGRKRLRNIKRALFPRQQTIDLWTLEQGCRQIAMLQSINFHLAGISVLEIGSGWDPVIPLLYFLAGSKKIILVDEQHLMDAANLKATVSALLDHRKKIAAVLDCTPADIANRLQFPRLSSLEDALSHFHIDYHAPFHFSRQSGLLPAVDLILSRAVLEHIPQEHLTKLFAVFAEKLSPAGKMVHIIDNSDHWEHKDKRLSRLHFLSQPPWLFKAISAFNRLDYQNRLRHSDYLKMFREAGFDVALDASKPDEKALTEIQHLALDENFRNYSPEDLAILTSYLVLARQRS